MVNLNEVPHLLEAYPTTDIADGKYKERIVWDVMPSYLMEHGECLIRSAGGSPISADTRIR